MRTAAAARPTTILVAACLAASLAGCSTPDVADRASELVGPVMEHHGGRLVSMKVHPKWGMATMADEAGTQVERIDFKPDTTPEAANHRPVDGARFPSVAIADFDVDGYLAKISETSTKCGMDDWEVTASALSSTAVLLTQICGGQQTTYFLNGSPVEQVDDAWSQDGFTTGWNELLTVAPSGQVLDLQISKGELTAELPAEVSGTSCQLAYRRALVDAPRFGLPVVSSQCQDSPQKSVIDLTTHGATTVWEQVASASREHGIALDEETSLHLHREAEGAAQLTLSRASQTVTIDLAGAR